MTTDASGNVNAAGIRVSQAGTSCTTGETLTFLCSALGASACDASKDLTFNIADNAVVSAVADFADNLTAGASAGGYKTSVITRCTCMIS